MLKADEFAMFCAVCTVTFNSSVKEAFNSLLMAVQKQAKNQLHVLPPFLIHTLF